MVKVTKGVDSGTLTSCLPACLSRGKVRNPFKARYKSAFIFLRHYARFVIHDQVLWTFGLEE
jgi:hypothetical protein